MSFYEHVFLARHNLTARAVDALVDTFKGVIETGGGKVLKVENWGLRPLAYHIKKNRKAYFLLMNIDAHHEVVKEMERQMKFNEDVINYMTVRVKELESSPSAMLQRLEQNGVSDRAPVGAPAPKNEESQQVKSE